MKITPEIEASIKATWTEPKKADEIIELIKKKKGNPNNFFKPDGSLVQSKEKTEEMLRKQENRKTKKAKVEPIAEPSVVIPQWQQELARLSYEELKEVEVYVAARKKEIAGAILKANREQIATLQQENTELEALLKPETTPETKEETTGTENTETKAE